MNTFALKLFQKGWAAATLPGTKAKHCKTNRISATACLNAPDCHSKPKQGEERR